MSDLPPGFVLDQPSDLPPGFQVDLPAGFVLDEPAAAQPTAGSPSTFPARPEFRGSNTRAEPGWGEYLGGIADQAGRGLTEGLVGIAGLPNTIARTGRDVTAWGLDAAGVPPEYTSMLAAIYAPVLGGTPDPAKINAGIDSLNNATADALGVERPRAEPENAAERYVNTAAEFLGGAAVPVGGAITTAERIGLEGARKLPWLTKSMVEPAAVNTGKFVNKEAQIALTSGLGYQGATDMFPDSPVAGLVGGVLAPVGLGIGSVVGGSLKGAYNAIRNKPQFVDQVVRDTVVDRLAKNADIEGSDVTGAPYDVDPIIKAIDNPDQMRPSSVFPGFQESLADRTRIPGIAALEYGRQSGNSGMFARRRMQNNEIIDASMRGLEPKTSPSYLRDALSTERERRLIDAESGLVTSEDEVAKALGLIVPDTTPAQRGNVVRTGLEDAREVTRTRVRDAYDKTDVDMNVDYQPLAQSLDEATASLTQTERALVPQGLVDRVAALGRPTVDEAGNEVAPAAMSLREATTLRSELQRLSAAAMADPKAERGGRNAARVLGQMQERVDEFIMDSLPPEGQAAMREARAARFDEGERFGRQGDPVYEVLQRYEGGQPKVRDDMVAGKFVNPQAMDRLFQEADTPEVRAAIREELLSKGDWVKPNWKNPDRIDTFMARYGEQMQRFPGMREELQSAATARMTEMKAADNLSSLKRDFGTAENEAGATAVGKYLRKGQIDTEGAMRMVIKSETPGKDIDDILAFAGNTPKATESARATFWEVLKREAQSEDSTRKNMNGKRAWDGGWLKDWIDEPKTVSALERLYKDKPEDLETIRRFADALENVDTSIRGKARATSGTAQGVNPALTPETLQSRTYAYASGRISGVYLVTSIVSQWARKAVREARPEAIERMTDQALLNPDFARALLKENNPANRAALARKAKGWLGPQAAEFLEGMNEDEDKDMKDAINGR